jgi:hypothetical protein
MMEKHPEEYSELFQHFSPGVAQFIKEFLPTKIIKDQSNVAEKTVPRGSVASISITGHEKGTTAMTLVESPLGMISLIFIR